MEITQYTYFQQVGGLDVFPVAGELTIGLERLSLYLQDKENVYDLRFNDEFTYGDIYLANEQQFSAFELESADVATCKRQFEDMEREVPRILARTRPPGSAPGAAGLRPRAEGQPPVQHHGRPRRIAVAERQSYIGRIRDLCKMCAEAWVESQGGNAPAREVGGKKSSPCPSFCSNCSPKRFPRACRLPPRATGAHGRASAWPPKACCPRP
jgi:glycyl-tRNA synthetase alpha chain